MAVQQKEYHRPEDWPRAHQLLNRTDVHTAPFIINPRPKALTDFDVDAFVDLQKLGLDTIQRGNGQVRLGAMTTLQTLYEADSLKDEAGGLLVEAAYISATLGLRNLASVGGAILDAGGPPDIPLALMALDAVVTVQQAEGQTRQAPLEEFIAAGGSALRRGEVLAAVSFVSAPDAFSALARVGRTPRDRAIVAAVAVLALESGAVRRAGVALAGANPIPLRLTNVEKMLAGQALSADLLDRAAAMAGEQADPQSDYRGSAEYRRAMAGVLTRRALAVAWDKSAKARG
ncbi:MAG: FAD binding domain-containing protein [Anaerolineaceae bacterium]|nr:FAD binding domain-containing protein [Anaerolineaceae bacterium]